MKLRLIVLPLLGGLLSLLLLAATALVPNEALAQAPQLSKLFSDPVAPGATTTLEFTLTHSAEELTAATDIGFTDDLDATLAGLAAIGLPLNDVCGPGSQISGDSLLTLTGGSLGLGASCTFSVTLQVPAGAASGDYLNTTSAVSATVGGEPVSSNPASDSLLVSGLTFAKSFIDDPAFGGGMVTLRFTLDNTASAVPATSIGFTDDLDATLSGLVAAGLPLNDVCGAGSTLSGTNLLTFTGGSVAAGGSCSFDVDLQVPVGTALGEYGNATSTLAVDFGAGVVALPAARDNLIVGPVLGIAKQFLADPVPAGGSVTLRFTLANASATDPVTGVAFTDGLDGVLSGLAATGYANDTCGATISGAGSISFSNGTVPAGGTCSFDATLSVPAGAAPGDYLNTTSSVTGSWLGNPVTAAAATDILTIQSLTFSKSFGGVALPGGAQTLSFTIQNLDAGNSVAGISFTDDLDAVLAGLAAAGLPVMDVCGAGSTLSGSSFLTLSNGSLPAGGSCTFGVTVQVPQDTALGDYVNTTSALLVSGLAFGPPASATLSVVATPGFTKAFAPATIVQGGVSSLTLSIDNAVNTLAASSLSFTDSLPAGLTVAPTPNASTDCIGGSLSAPAGGSAITYSGGTVSGGASCTVSVDVTAGAPGLHANTTGDLTSSLGNSGSANATLTVISLPGFTLAFSPPSILAGDVSTLVFTVDNAASPLAASALAFSNSLPANLIVAAAPNAVTTCTGGALTALAGASAITYAGGTVGAGSTCTIAVDVTSNVNGQYLNTTGDLTSSAGNSGPASGRLVVGDPLAIPSLGWLAMAMLGAILAAGAAVSLRRSRHA